MSQVILHSLITKNGSWSIRIDSPHGDKDYHHKHVHISKKGLSGEYSWNEDGSRHDKHRFPNQEQCITKATKLAEEALGLSNGTLHFISMHEGKVRYLVETFNEDSTEIFRTYIHKDKVVIIMMSSKGLVSIIVPMHQALEP